MERKTPNAMSTEQLLLYDGILPSYIAPALPSNNDYKAVLLTGVTGFLGGYLLAELLANSNLDIYCLVRSKNIILARERILESLSKTERTNIYDTNRIHAVCGDVALTHFGLSEAEYNELVKNVQMIIHSAAQVNWIKSYKALRSTNVIGTRNVIEFACKADAKPVYFVSTLSVCYANRGPERVDESTNMSSYVGAMPLGYAQTKCISESLLHQASERGLPVAVIRPSLLCGDTKTGRTNEDDLISRLVKGCITMGIASDVDWKIDCSPVDITAKIIVSCVRKKMAQNFWVIHVHHPNPRPWQEMILWLNLFGYSVNLVSLDIWLEQLEAMPRQICPEFYMLRSFFLARPAMLEGRRQPELYLESTRKHINSKNSNQWLTDNNLTLPPVNAPLLSRYFDSYVAKGYLPSIANKNVVQNTDDLDASFIELSLRQAYADSSIKVLNYSIISISHGSIINELCAARTGAMVGVWRVYGEYETAASKEQFFDIVVKVKTDDTVPLQIAESIAKLRGGEIEKYPAELIRTLGIIAAHHRELAICATPNHIFASFMPQIFATKASPESGIYMVAMEYLHDAKMLNSIAIGKAWTKSQIQIAIHGLAEIHSVWHGKEKDLREYKWMLPPLDSTEIRQMLPFWYALAKAAEPVFVSNLGVSVSLKHQDYLQTMPEWWQTMRTFTHTLIHNDFNPRNIALKRKDEVLSLCVYDWELAAIGIPQHDIAELLCFTLPEESTKDDILAYLELHRIRLEALTGKAIDNVEWILGFNLSLRYLLVSRLALYALYHQTSPQSFLPTVLKNWQRLHNVLA